MEKTCKSELADTEAIKKKFSNKFIGREIRYRPVIDSTNSFLMSSAADSFSDGTVLIAEKQTAGRGRMQRKWYSPENCNLYFSLLLRPDILPERAPQISLVAAYAVLAALSGLFPEVDFRIKWPNDILAGKKKLAGILCEMVYEAGKKPRIVIGTGLNVNLEPAKFPDAIKDVATSIFAETSHKQDRSLILARILEEFEKAYFAWLNNNTDLIIHLLNRKSSLTGKFVKVEQGGRLLAGKVTEINEQGELVLNGGNGLLIKVSSGEVHILKE
ncbi:MAG: biotin--[acetyl-CoA-carboxylase] ligase [Candidatus Rifleibacteriota bacterium]